MSLEYTYDPQTRLIRIACKGAISIDERIQLVHHLMDDPHLPASASILIDVNEVTNVPNYKEIGVIGSLIEKLLSRFRDRVAILNAKVGHVTLSHMVSLTVGGKHGQVRVFSCETDARTWFGA